MSIRPHPSFCLLVSRTMHSYIQWVWSLASTDLRTKVLIPLIRISKSGEIAPWRWASVAFVVEIYMTCKLGCRFGQHLSNFLITWFLTSLVSFGGTLSHLLQTKRAHSHTELCSLSGEISSASLRSFSIYSKRNKSRRFFVRFFFVLFFGFFGVFFTRHVLSRKKSSVTLMLIQWNFRCILYSNRFVSTNFSYRILSLRLSTSFFSI